MNTPALIEEDNCELVIAELEDAFLEIPFGNSTFQTEMFVIAAQITPARMYRQIGLSLISKLQDVQLAQIDREKSDLKRERLEALLSGTTLDPIERRETEIAIKEMSIGSYMAQKALTDTLVELNVLYAHFRRFPRLTREQFEAGEKLHFEQRLARQVSGLSGPKESALNIIDDRKTLDTFEKSVEKLSVEELAVAIGHLSKDCLEGRMSMLPEEN